MLVINTFDSDVYGKSYNWKLGEQLPTNVCIEDVTSLVADEDELEFIKNNFTGVPMTRHTKSVFWTGEIAKFIYEHLIDE